MDQSTHEVRLSQWKEIIEQCQSRPEGMTAKQWLSEKEIPEKSYYYWLRRIRKLTYEQMEQASLPSVSSKEVSFVQMPFPTEEHHQASPDPVLISPEHPDIVIRTKHMEIGIYNSVSNILLSTIMKEIGHAV